MADRSVIVRLGADVSGFVSGMGRAASAAGDLGNKIATHVDKNSEQYRTLGNVALGTGAAIMAGVALAVKTFADFDAQMSAVQAATHETSANMERLRDTAMQLGADTQFSAREAAQGMEELAKAGVSTNDIIGGGLKGSLDLAAAGGLSVAESAETAATALTQFKLSGEQVPHVADLLAAGAGKAQGSVHDLGMALNQSGLVASQYGLTLEETVGGLSAFASAGLIGSDAGTSFKTMLMSLAAPSKKAQTTLDDLGISMYDQSGKFVGLANLAGQLQTKMSGLSEAERNTAMATIFGTDAVRAANVLYAQGQGGIQGWIDKTNDAGYAAETAALRMNNLKGDLEKLRGALETALIGLGAGADGPLREVVQSVSGAVDAFSRLPPAVQQAQLMMAAFAGTSLLMTGGIIRAVVGVSEFVVAVRTLAPALAAANAKIIAATAATTLFGLALRQMTMFAALAAAELAALWLAGQIAQRIWETSTPSVERYADALRELGKGGPEALGSLDAAIQSTGANQVWYSFTNRVTDTASAFSALKANTNWFNEATTGIAGMVGMTTQLSLLRDQVVQIDAALAGMDTKEAASAFQGLSAEMQRAGYTSAQMVDLFPQYKAALAQVAQQLGVAGLSQQDYYLWMMGNVPAAIQAATAATGQNAQALTQQATAADQAKQSMQELGNAMLAQSGSLIGLEAAFDAATESIKKNGASHDLNTEKGRSNQTALDGIASSALKYAENAAKAGTSTDVISGKMQGAREQFIATAQRMGYTADEARGLADAYGLIPSNVSTSVSAPGTPQARQQVNDLIATLGNVPPAVSSWVRTYAETHGVDEVQAAIASLRDRQITITTRHVEQYIYQGTRVAGITAQGGLTKADGGLVGADAWRAAWTPAHIGAPRFADGGGFTGYGARRQDVLPAWLSRMEYVQPDTSVDYYGLPVMEAMRRRIIPRELFSQIGFAQGGSPAGAVSTPQWAGVSGRDIEQAFRRALASEDVVVVRRSDWSLMGGGV